MTRLLTRMALTAAMVLLPAWSATAQGIGVPPAPAVMLPPPPAPPPPPTIVPIVPNAPLPTPKANLQLNGSQDGTHGERFERCLGEAATRGVAPGDRASYASGCANN